MTKLEKLIQELCPEGLALQETKFVKPVRRAFDMGKSIPLTAYGLKNVCHIQTRLF